MAIELDPSIITRGLQTVPAFNPMAVMEQVNSLNAQRQQAQVRDEQIRAANTVEAERQQKIAAEKKKLEEDAKVEQARQTGVHLDANGVFTYDPSTLEQQFNQNGLSHRLPGVLKEISGFNEITAKANKAKAEASQARTEAVAGLARAALEMDGGTPASFSAAANLALLNGHTTKEELAPFVEVAQADPSHIPNVLRALIQQSTKGAEVGVQQANAATSAAGQVETGRHNIATEQTASGNAAREVAAQIETARHNRAGEAFERDKLNQANADKTELSPAGLDAAAMMFAKTGALPALGMGDKTTRKAIINRAAVMVPGLDLATAKADFGANTESLKNVTKTLDTLSAFESTAGKNLDQFLALAAKVPDTGVPWLNTPVRLLNNAMVGSENQAAANAARDVALREIARVTNDPKLSGVLSDSARHEVAGLSPQNATFAQVKKVAQVLKQDMANVHSSLTDQRDAIGARIKLGNTPETPSGSATVRMRAPNGQEQDVPADQVAHYKSKGATVVQK